MLNDAGTPDRTLAVTIGDGPTYLFKLNAPVRMVTYLYQSDWMKPDAVEGAAGGVGERMEVKCGMFIRIFYASLFTAIVARC